MGTYEKRVKLMKYDFEVLRKKLTIGVSVAFSVLLLLSIFGVCSVMIYILSK